MVRRWDPGHNGILFSESALKARIHRCAAAKEYPCVSAEHRRFCGQAAEAGHPMTAPKLVTAGLRGGAEVHRRHRRQLRAGNYAMCGPRHSPRFLFQCRSAHPGWREQPPAIGDHQA